MINNYQVLNLLLKSTLLTFFLFFINNNKLVAQQDINDPRFERALNLHKQGQFAWSSQEFQFELDTAVQAGDWKTYYDAQNWIVKNYWKQNLLDSAKIIIDDILANIEAKLGKESLTESQTYNELGVVYDKGLNYPKALDAYKACLDIRIKKLPADDLGIGQVYFNIGTCYSLQEQSQKGLEYFEKALFVFQRSLPKNHLNLGWVYQNLAEMSSKLGGYEAGIRYWRQALAIFLENYGPDNPRVGIAYLSMAKVVLREGFDHSSAKKDLEEAQIWLDQAYKIISSIVGEEHPYIVDIFRTKGVLFFKADQLKQSELLLEKAIALSQRIMGPKNLELATSYLGMGEIIKKQSLYLKALMLLQKGLIANYPEFNDTSIFQLPPSTKMEAFSARTGLLLVGYKAYTFRSLYDKTKEERYWEAMVEHRDFYLELANKLLREYTSVGDKKGIVTLEFKLFHELSLIHYEKEDYATLLHFSEQSKSIFLKQTLDYANAKELGGIPDSLKQKELALKRQISKQHAEILQAEKGHQDSLAKALKSELFEYTRALNAHIENLEKLFPEYYEIKYQDHKLEIAEIQENLLDDKTMLLEYFINANDVYMIGISKNDLKVKRVENWTKVQKTVNNYRQSISDIRFITKNENAAKTMYTESAYELYQLLVEDFVKDQRIEKLIVVPDKALGRIPFEALLTKKVDVQKDLDYEGYPYLIQDLSIQYAYSAALLMHNHGGVAKGSGQMAAFAAAYNPNAASFETTDPVLLKLRRVLKDLPGAKQEVEGLQIFEGDFYLGEDANEASFKALDFKNYSVIHLAMHGVMNKKNPMLSSLAFSEKKDSLEDDFLHAYELTNLKIPCELMVLSACETGDGSLSETEGVMSLARSCMYAGLPSVLMTMWQVNDASTSIIIREFYENLNQGMTKSAALQAAKLNYIKHTNGLIAQPNFWAALVVLGNDRPIHLNKKTNFNWWYLLGAVGLVGLLLFAINKRKNA